MSKRKQTENLHLYAYENLRGLPTFLKDWSDNMAILDGAHSTILSLIDGLNGRLTTAEGLIEDLSPESIEDYKIRLDALEKKVVINTNSIKDVNTKIATVNAQINSINVEQGVQNNRLTTLEGVVSNHSTLISELRTDLTGVDDRVTTLEQCCENVQHEIADMQNDINGFNDDVTALATQVETLSTTVNELTDLVNSLQLDVVSQRLDAFETDLAGLTTRMTNAENDIVSNSDAIDALGVRMTDSESDIANVQNEIGDTDYSEVGDTISSSLVELADRIRALTPQEYDVLVARLATAESNIDTLQSDVNTLQGDISTVDGNVTSLQNTVSGVQSDIVDLQSDVGTAQNNIASLDGDVSDIQAVIPSDASALNKLMAKSDYLAKTFLTALDNSTSSDSEANWDIDEWYGYCDNYKYLYIEIRRDYTYDSHIVDTTIIKSKLEELLAEALGGGYIYRTFGVWTYNSNNLHFLTFKRTRTQATGMLEVDSITISPYCHLKVYGMN